ncbi:hypothetical protein ABE437_09490 [Isoptericola cucumis]|uniref:hypothetical protein n=1 Tax=Isoptericola cucumis TaxID=1776856 RepID=UPI00320803F4
MSENPTGEDPTDEDRTSENVVTREEQERAPGTPTGREAAPGEAPKDDPDEEGEDRFDAG